MSDPEPYYVYVYRDPRPGKNCEPIYVGKGKGRRAYSHWKRETGNPHLRNKLAKIRAAGLEPVIEIVQRFEDEKSALRYEKQLVKKYGRVDLGTGTLCNWTDGGEAPVNFGPVLKGKISAATKQAYTDSELRARNNAAIKQAYADPEVRARCNVANKQTWADLERRARLSATLKQVWADPEVRARMSERMKQLWADPKHRERTIAGRWGKRARG
jgi:hypothetical protein